MPKQKLFDEDSEEEVQLKTETEYAKKYDKWREKEELHKLEQKYGSKALNSDASTSSDSEDESDEPPEVSEETETQFLKTLALLKTKDPRIYDPEFKFFDENEKKELEKETKPNKLTFADSEDDDDDDDDGNIFSIEKKAEIVENDTKLVPTKSEPKEAKLKDFLTGKAEHIDNKVEKDLAPLKALWSDPKLNEGEAFLRDYILNKGYLEDGDFGDAEDKVRDDEELEADEQRVEEQGKFERAYNFRFEEPDQEYLKRFPRTMNYIRPKDDRRSRKRVELRTRKEEEKQRKMEEIARLKAFKLKEIQEKIARIKEVTGNEDLAFKEDDLNSDFDPAEHDQRMKEIFDEQYYGDVDDEKPEFPDLDEELEIENWDQYEPEHLEAGLGEAAHCEDEDFNMDADYDPKKAREELIEELKRSQGKKPRNRKKKSKLAELLTTDKPKFIPSVAEKTYNEYMEEYYKMDCEDVIGGDLPTRFKYRDVVPNDYGLTVEEILLADDKELTQWVPLKRLLRHRPDNVEIGEAKTYKQRAADLTLKKKILPSLFKDLPEDPDIVVPIEGATKKKKKKKNKNKDQQQESIQEDSNQPVDKEEQNKNTVLEKTKTRDISKSCQEEKPQEVKIGNREFEKKKKKRYVSNDFVVEEVQNTEPSHVSIQDIEVNKNKEDTQKVEDNIGNGTEKVWKKKKLGNNISNDVAITENGVKNLKRKADTDVQQPAKKKKNVQQPAKQKKKGTSNAMSKKDRKMKFKQKDKLRKKNDDQTGNPLNKLSDERLKAYGLNPKKYRNFIKYKKF